MTSRPAPRRPRRASAGASRKPQPRNLFKPLRVLLKLSAVGGLLAGIVALVVWARPMDHIRELTDRPIAGVTIEAEFEYLSQERVQHLVAERLTENFLQLDMAAMKQALEADPWIASATVSRQWPDQLVVRVLEEQPIARWGDKAFVNMRGEIVRVNDNALLTSLPLLFAEDQHAKEVMQKYVQMSRLLAPMELKLRAVQLDETLSWTLYLADDITVRVGRDQVFEKLQRWSEVYAQKLAKKRAEIASVDLRYDNGFAVSWKSSGVTPMELASGN